MDLGGREGGGGLNTRLVLQYASSWSSVMSSDEGSAFGGSTFGSSVCGGSLFISSSSSSEVLVSLANSPGSNIASSSFSDDSWASVGPSLLASFSDETLVPSLDWLVASTGEAGFLLSVGSFVGAVTLDASSFRFLKQKKNLRTSNFDFHSKSELYKSRIRLLFPKNSVHNLISG